MSRRIPLVAIAVVEIRRPGPNIAMAHKVDAATAKVEGEEQAAVVVPPSDLPPMALTCIVSSCGKRKRNVAQPA